MRDMIIRLLLISVSIIEFYSYMPQIIKIIKTKKAADLSINSWLLWSICSTIYTLYVGLVCLDVLLLITSFIEAFLNVTTFFLAVLYTVKIKEIKVPASKDGYKLMEVRHGGCLYRVSSYAGHMEFHHIHRKLKSIETAYAAVYPRIDSICGELYIYFLNKKGEVKNTHTFDYKGIEDTVIKLKCMHHGSISEKMLLALSVTGIRKGMNNND